MNKVISIAARNAIKDAKGSVSGFCATYGHNEQTVYTKLNPNDEKSWLNLVELEEVIEYTNDTRILDAVCSLFNAKWTLNDSPSEICNTTQSKTTIKEAADVISALAQTDYINATTSQRNEIDKELLEARNAIDAQLISNAKIKNNVRSTC